MPVLLYGVGAVAVAIGIAVIGFGIPINEFSFGNTLIIAGTTAAAGGLVVIAIGVAVAQLQRLTDALATRAPVRSSRPFDTFDPAPGARPPAAPPRVAFPPKTKPESRPEAKADAGPRETIAREHRTETPQPLAAPFPERSNQERLTEFAAPTLPNPDEPPVTVADEAFLSPLHPAPYSPRAPIADLDRAPSAGLDRDEYVPPPAPRKPHTYFDAMWPAEPKSAEPKSTETKPTDTKVPEPKLAEQKPAEPSEPKSPEFQWSDVRRGEPSSSGIKPGARPPVAGDLREQTSEQPADAAPDEEDAPRAVAILKSGVVDGMGYTLYVDGSIEAELPQGTLRFASINELRSHLEKTS